MINDGFKVITFYCYVYQIEQLNFLLKVVLNFSIISQMFVFIIDIF